MAHQIRILAIEDEITVQFFVSEALRYAGYQVTAAGSAEEALGCLNTDHPALAIVDLGLPGMGGLELLPILRARCPDTVLVVLSAHDTRSKALLALRSGAVDFLPKPCTTGELREAVRVALDCVAARQRQQQLLTRLEQDEGASVASVRNAVIVESGGTA
ncbi:MAG: response regulator [Anaerolineae bacterium]|nr:response regulator [Anaerolineae bacterium]